MVCPCRIITQIVLLTFKGEIVFDLRIKFVPRSKHSASVIKTDKLMLYREIIAVCSEIHAKHKCIVGRT